MPAIGIALLWVAYSGGLWGYCMVRGYNITFRQLLSTTWPPLGPGAQAGQTAKNAVGQVGPTAVGESGGTGLNFLGGSTPGVPSNRGPF